jgi:hypothetical protein
MRLIGMTRSRRAALAATLIAVAIVALVIRKQLWRAGSANVLEASAAEVSSDADSMSLAKAALERCSKITGDKIPCYE